jgi:hypothetical protein
MFSGHYSHPDGFCFDVLCTDDPVIDNPELEGYNVDERVSMKPRKGPMPCMKQPLEPGS